jgi:hypothetical protein
MYLLPKRSRNLLPRDKLDYSVIIATEKSFISKGLSGRSVRYLTGGVGMRPQSFRENTASRIIEAVIQINDKGVFIPNGPDSRICINRNTLDVSISDLCFWCSAEECNRKRQMKRLMRWLEYEEYDTFVEESFWKPYL